MKNLLTFSLFIVLLSACSEDDELTSQIDLEDFYVNFRVDSTVIQLNEEKYDVVRGEEISGCIDGFTYGMWYTNLVSKNQVNSFVTNLGLGIYRKVPLTDLGAPKEVGPGVFRSFTADSLRYMRETLYNQNFGASYAVTLPLDDVNTSIIKDSVNNAVLAEAFLTIRMQDEEFRSFSDDLFKRDESSYFQINHILKLSDSSPREYSYIIEGEFNVDMYYGGQKDPVLVAGDFRLPIYTYYTNKVLAKCD